jgi:hypothetical protein
MGCLLQKRKRAPTLGARKKAKPEKDLQTLTKIAFGSKI